jgi:hypothetical protein
MMSTGQKRAKMKSDFLKRIQNEVDLFNRSVATDQGDWIVKGFIDVVKNIYTISIDTKVISKIMELLLFPQICSFAEKSGLKIILSKEQNFYPDITFVDDKDNKYAVDIKSTYRKNEHSVNGMTLGAFTGYFRDRKSQKNITFPYADYLGHFVLGIIYSRDETVVDERKVYQLAEINNITSVIRDFDFFVQEKYRIASDQPGSGNTKNIGSSKTISELKNGTGMFADLGESVFDDYWMYYLTKEMAEIVKLPKQPYKIFWNIRNTKTSNNAATID